MKRIIRRIRGSNHHVSGFTKFGNEVEESRKPIIMNGHPFLGILPTVVSRSIPMVGKTRLTMHSACLHAHGNKNCTSFDVVFKRGTTRRSLLCVSRESKSVNAFDSGIVRCVWRISKINPETPSPDMLVVVQRGYHLTVSLIVDGERYTARDPLMRGGKKMLLMQQRDATVGRGRGLSPSKVGQARFFPRKV